MKRMIPVIAICLASSAVCARSQTAQSNLSSIDEYLQTAMQKSHVPGISVAVVQDGKLILARGYGLANVELSVPATENLPSIKLHRSPKRSPQPRSTFSWMKIN